MIDGFHPDSQLSSEALVDGGEVGVIAIDGGGKIPVAVADRGEGGEGRDDRGFHNVGCLKEASEQRLRVELTEEAAEGGGGCHCMAPHVAGEGGAHEHREGQKANEDGEQEVIGEGFDGGWV
jgi:hypothetical protein